MADERVRSRTWARYVAPFLVALVGLAVGMMYARTPGRRRHVAVSRCLRAIQAFAPDGRPMAVRDTPRMDVLIHGPCGDLVGAAVCRRAFDTAATQSPEVAVDTVISACRSTYCMIPQLQALGTCQLPEPRSSLDKLRAWAGLTKAILVYEAQDEGPTIADALDAARARSPVPFPPHVPVPTSAVPTSAEPIVEIRAEVGPDKIVRISDSDGRRLDDVPLVDLRSYLDAHRADLARFTTLRLTVSPVDANYQRVLVVIDAFREAGIADVRFAVPR
jgi:hypothetical protein